MKHISVKLYNDLNICFRPITWHLHEEAVYDFKHYNLSKNVRHQIAIIITSIASDIKTNIKTGKDEKNRPFRL